MTGLIVVLCSLLGDGGQQLASAALLSFSNGATATPPTVNVPQPNPTVSVIPDTLGLAGQSGYTQAQWSTALTASLTAKTPAP